ncbi:MAG: DUF5666 domain-containing protein [Chloroflexota bacterium]
MEIRPEPIRSSRRLPLQLLIAAVLLSLAAVAVGASLMRPGALAPTQLAAAGASQAPAASPDGSAAPDTGKQGRGFGFGFGFGPSVPGRVGFGGRGSFLGAVSVTAVDGASVSLESANGWKRTIDTTGVTITRAGVTITAADLKAGDKVSISESRNKDGSFTVKGIAVALEQAGGTITKLEAGKITVERGKATSTITTGGATVYRRDGQAITRDDLAVGQKISAAGTKASDGSLAAEAIDVQPDVVMGTVTKIDGSTLTISTPGGGSATVKLTAKTSIKVQGKDTATAADITTKSMVVAQGVKGADGVLIADSVRAGSWRAATPNNGRGWHGWRGDPSPSASPAS